MWDVVAAQLASMRAQVGALQAQVDVMQAIVDEQLAVSEAATESCPHEQTEVDPDSTLTEKRERCLQCGKVLITAAA